MYQAFYYFGLFLIFLYEGRILIKHSLGLTFTQFNQILLTARIFIEVLGCFILQAT